MMYFLKIIFIQNMTTDFLEYQYSKSKLNLNYSALMGPHLGISLESRYISMNLVRKAKI